MTFEEWKQAHDQLRHARQARKTINIHSWQARKTQFGDPTQRLDASTVDAVTPPTPRNPNP